MPNLPNGRPAPKKKKPAPKRKVKPQGSPGTFGGWNNPPKSSGPVYKRRDDGRPVSKKTGLPKSYPAKLKKAVASGYDADGSRPSTKGKGGSSSALSVFTSTPSVTGGPMKKTAKQKGTPGDAVKKALSSATPRTGGRGGPGKLGGEAGKARAIKASKGKSRGDVMKAKRDKQAAKAAVKAKYDQLVRDILTAEKKKPSKGKGGKRDEVAQAKQQIQKMKDRKKSYYDQLQELGLN